ncbi:DNA cytosine methyltransferase [Aureitalea marina]|uniref:Cytosine-specific methyltransferase n=1 Tax=Aureitalea marina TaxID=930804 RepID=A0A2S7KNC5_9FLAO|nr:DNA cytosine methyltransferase [Aureitalea marina]PQB04122.1 hypothetical protein BST85_03800 [Aureitalea marina]
MKNKRRHIELFAGCGGMAVGMENAGFSLVFANEVSPMASNTFAHNILGVNIEEQPENVKWIHSKYDRSNYNKRLRENLLDPKLDENCELEFDANLGDLEGNLLVGDVRQLRRKLFDKNIFDPYNKSLDLISGGPPCQSFSLAGRRELGNYKNRLPLDFAEICEKLQPKVVLLENVKGILSAFNDGGEKHYAWFEVAKAFALIGYAPLCMLLNSKYFGVAQNRPRYIMIALRSDILNKLIGLRPNNTVLNKVSGFLQKASENTDQLTIKDLDYYDIERDLKLFDGHVLPLPITFEPNTWFTVKDAIDDLRKDQKGQKSPYVHSLHNELNSNSSIDYKILNHNERSHTEKVKNRFLFYQLLSSMNGLESQILLKVRNGERPTRELIKEAFNYLSLKLDGFDELFKTYSEFSRFILSIELTKKHSQRALISSLPSPAQLTIPDDMCHYSPFENRVLTVREMARIQSFPDWFVFKSKETTGGSNRSYEVPQYTQVGNAVPPLLAFHLGQHISSLLDQIE